MIQTSLIMLIDDDPLCNLLSSHTIKLVDKEVTLIDFTSAEDALNYISLGVPEYDQITILLDINMPILNGWDFLARFHLLDQEIRERYNIHILSSSIDLADIQRAKTNLYVKDFLMKPLTVSLIEPIIKDLCNTKQETVINYMHA